MSNPQSFVYHIGDMRAEQSANAFSALLRQDGDQIRRDVFVMVPPEKSVSGRITAGYTTIYPGCTARGHAHADREEVYYFVKGCGVMIVDGVETEVTAGDTFYLKPGPFHSTRNPSDFTLEFFWITVRVD